LKEDEMTRNPERRAKWIRIGVIAVIVLALGGWAAWYNFFRTEPQDAWVNENLRNHFLYGSIGQESIEGIPYWIFVVLPKVFPEYLPAPGGYASLGMSWEPGPGVPGKPPHELPMGVTTKVVGFKRVGLNCAFCHVTRLRLSPEQAIPDYYVGGPAQQFRVQDYQWFLFRSANDPRFNSSVLMSAIGGVTKLSLREKLLYRFLLIPATRSAILKQKAAFEWQFTHGRPLQGPGRVDPFNPVRFRFFHEADDGSIGNTDIPSIWNQRDRVGGWLHWDGLARRFDQVAISSAIGDGARNQFPYRGLDLDSLHRIGEFLTDLRPPKYPLPVDASLAAQGAPVFQANCAECHALHRARNLHPIDVKEVGTDAHREQQWTQSQVDSWKQMAADYKRKYDAKWTFDTFAKNPGYVAVLLDGVWLRGPYLHNGSVPSLRDLLNPPGARPKQFYRGYDVLDAQNVGFVSDVKEFQGQPFFLYDTTLPGNGNQGHEFGTKLPDDQKKALLEYLKTL
jgi:hypothetical protein